jgi:hypothetical protein
MTNDIDFYIRSDSIANLLKLSPANEDSILFKVWDKNNRKLIKIKASKKNINTIISIGNVGYSLDIHKDGLKIDGGSESLFFFLLKQFFGECK